MENDPASALYGIAFLSFIFLILVILVSNVCLIMGAIWLFKHFKKPKEVIIIERRIAPDQQKRADNNAGK